MLASLPASAADTSAQPAPAARLDAFLSQKLRFWSLIAMLLLVYVHAYNLHPRYLQPWTPVDEPLAGGTWLQYFLANGLLRFRIPILFAISGYLFAHHEGREPHGVRVKRRVRSLLVPYIVWSALGLAFTWALEQFPATRQLVLGAALSPFGTDVSLVSQYTPGQLLTAWLLIPLPFQLWFIRSLFFYNLGYPWLRAAVDRAPLVYFAVTGAMWVLGLGLPMIEGTGLCFFGLGVWLRRRDIEVQVPPRWFNWWLFAVVWLVIVTVKTWLAFHLERPSFSVMSLLHRASELLGMLVMWYGADGLVRVAMRQRWFTWIASFSFIIYVLHVPLLSYATEAALYFWPGQHLLVFVLLPLATFAFSVGVGALLRRVAPPVYELLTGGRGL
ncbi:acyltransferase [Hymenobacter sp. HSC-4F20]|uniref:acyltransferase family protein n=1 Tax=Hymenobacter sp. HSC-4F20 TaxID=2864135 RepID=UPI001C72D1A3|nr:acyltransferase [Hymenobacter sp. HSC-4F20]MBX0291591.1 acyltransferase [Hymenobacter sp. HSC-4F20]